MTASADLVLVIDDSEVYRYFALVTLREAGYRVALAASVTDGLRQVECCNPRIVCIDHQLPDGDSTIITTALRTTMPKVMCGIVVFSGDGGQRARDKALSVGADVFLEKGTCPEQLLAAVRTAVVRSAVRLV